MMTEEQLSDALDMLYMSDGVVHDNGRLIGEVRRDLKRLSTHERQSNERHSQAFESLMARFIWRYFLCPAAIANRNGIEDVKDFIDFVQELMLP